MFHDLSFSDAFHTGVIGQTQLISEVMCEEGVLQIGYRLKQLSGILFVIFIRFFFDCVILIQLNNLVFYNHI